MTVSSFTSVSLHPPLILVCIDKSAAFLEGVAPELPFAVNVLSDKQQSVAVRFAGREADRFAGLEWKPGWCGVPLISGAVASLACSLERVIDAGDHLVLIAEVRQIEQRSGSALIWCRRNYHCLPDP